MEKSDRPSFHQPSAILPQRAAPDFWTFTVVEGRLVEAMGVLLRSADRERGWLNPGNLSIWRLAEDDMTQEAADDRPIVTCALTRAEVARADEALGWVARSVAAGDTRRVLGIGLRQLCRDDQARIEWPRVWDRMGGAAGGWTTEGLRKRYNRAITAICHALNASNSGG